MIGPTSGEVTDSYMFEQAYGRPIGHLHEKGEKEYRERVRRTTACPRCDKQVLYAMLDGRRRPFEPGHAYLVVFRQGELVAQFRGEGTHKLHRCGE